MKRILYLLPVIAILSAFHIMAGIDDVVAGIRSGNASTVAKYFDNNVEISTPDKSNSYSKSQAELVLKDFFANNPVKSFEVIHKGANDGSEYCIGTLVTKSGSFRTTIFMKKKGDNQFLQELRFESK